MLGSGTRSGSKPVHQHNCARQQPKNACEPRKLPEPFLSLSNDPLVRFGSTLLVVELFFFIRVIDSSIITDYRLREGLNR